MKQLSAVSSLSAVLLLLDSLALTQVVRWNIQKHPETQSLDRRADSTVQTDTSNNQAQGGYFVSVEIGTPGQQLSLQLDTGSSDLWVPSSGAAICEDKSQGGCSLGSFNPRQSSTFEVVAANGFQISYQDNSSSTGDYFTDVLHIGSASINNVTMGLGLKTDVPFGLLGVGYVSNEASTQTENAEYPNVPVAMQQAGLINSVAYSLWLNDLDSSSGDILFGGIDTDKYVGNLTRLPIQPQRGQFTSFAVSMFSLEATSPSGSDVLTSDNLPVDVILDSGTTLSYIPQDLAIQVWEEVGATYDSSLQTAVIPCSFQNHAGYFSFTFSGSDGPRINITMDELVVSLAAGNPPKFSNGPYQGQEACEFGIQNSTDAPYLLGDTFLRSAYVVYDLVNNEVGMAATDFNSTKSNIVAFASEGATIPSATLVNNGSQSQPQPTQTGLTAANGFQAGAGSGEAGSGCPSLQPNVLFTFVTLILTITTLTSKAFI